MMTVERTPSGATKASGGSSKGFSEPALRVDQHNLRDQTLSAVASALFINSSDGESGSSWQTYRHGNFGLGITCYCDSSVTRHMCNT